MSLKSFNDCAKSGGKVKVKNLKNNKYIDICYDKQGKAYPSKVMSKKNKDGPVDLKNKLLKLKDYYDKNYRV